MTEVSMGRYRYISVLGDIKYNLTKMYAQYYSYKYNTNNSIYYILLFYSLHNMYYLFYIYMNNIVRIFLLN